MSKARAAAARKANVARRGGQAEGSPSASPSRLTTPPPEVETSSRWPVQKIEHRNIEKLIPYTGNARTHGAEQVAQLAASIEEFGWTIPVLIAEDDTIIAGHGRILAAQQLSITTMPVMVARGKITGSIPLSVRFTATSGPCWSKTPASRWRAETS